MDEKVMYFYLCMYIYEQYSMVWQIMIYDGENYFYVILVLEYQFGM